MYILVKLKVKGFFTHSQSRGQGFAVTHCTQALRADWREMTHPLHTGTESRLSISWRALPGHLFSFWCKENLLEVTHDSRGMKQQRLITLSALEIGKYTLWKYMFSSDFVLEVYNHFNAGNALR